MSWQNKPQPQVFGGKSKPDVSAQVEIESGGEKGFLGPRMTTAERLAIPSPAEGLEVYDLDVHALFVFNGTGWVSPSGVSPASIPVTDDSVARFDGTSGALIQDSALIINDTGDASGLNSVEAGNVHVEGNEISTINTDGDLTLNPNGTGKVVIAKDLQVLGTTTTVNSDTLDVADANITINSGGNQASADTLAGITVEMSDATDAKLIYDSTTESKFKVGEEGAEEEIVTTQHTQEINNKTISNGATVAAGLSMDMSSTTLATKPWPTMTEAERDATTPSQGWVIYNTDQNELNIFDGVDWIPYNIGVYFMIENGYKRDFSTDNLTTTFTAIKTITGGTLKAMDVVNNSGNEIKIRVDSGVEMLIGAGATRQIGYRGLSDDVVEIATVSGTATEGIIYINFLGV